MQLIRDLSQPEQWCYEPTQENPADDASRGLTIQAPAHQQRLQSGPKFLWQSKLFWPNQPVLTKHDATNDSKIERNCESCVASISSSHILNELVSKYSNCKNCYECMPEQFILKNYFFVS